MVMKIAVFTMALTVLVSSPSMCQEMALKDYKNVYLTYEAKASNPYWQMKDDILKKYKEEFATMLKGVGFNIVNDAKDADILVNCNFKDVQRGLKWNIIDEAIVKFTLPKSNITVVSYKIGNKSWVNTTFTIKEAEDIFIDRITTEYNSNKPLISIDSTNPANATIINRASPLRDGMTLKDFKNVYIDLEVNYKFTTPVDKKEYYGYISELKDKLKGIGFNLVDNIKDADLKIIFNIKGAEHALGYGLLAEKAWANFIVTDGDLVIDKITAKYRYPNDTIKNSVFKDLIEKIKIAYRSEDIKIKLDSKGRPIKIDKPRHVYSMLGKDIIYDGDEIVNNELWKDPIMPLMNIKIEGNEQGKKSIGILVYHSDVRPTSKYYDRKKDTVKRVKEYGVSVSKPDVLDKFIENYGYLVRYDLNTRRFAVNYFSRILDSIKGFSADSDPGSANIGQNHIFWRDISYLISARLRDYFISKDFRVVNLTPARDELNQLKPYEIINKINDLYKIDKIILVPFTAYTKLTYSMSPGVISGAPGRVDTLIGFYLSYDAYIYEGDNDIPVFEFSEDITPISPDASSILQSKISFFSAEVDNLGQMKALKDGVIDDEWIVEKMIRKFSGYEKGITEKVRIGGDLFAKLSEDGY